MSENNAFLEVKDLYVEYTSDNEIIHAVNGVSLQLKKGETLGLVGETGAGKTSIAKAIMRILPDPPAKITGGEVWLDGQDLLKLPENEMLKIRGKKVAMIFQDPMTALNPVMTIGSQIAEVIALHERCSRREAEAKAVEMLEMVGITANRFHEYPHQFSGGMKQRVVIAMALACNPELLLADEPTTALDVTIQAQVLEMINELKVRYNTAMILVTHDLGVVAGSCDHVAVTYAGEIIEYGDLEALYDHTAHPYTIGLFNSLPDIKSTAKRLSPIEGLPPDPRELPSGCKFHPRCPQAVPACSQGEVPLREIAPGHLCRCLLAERKEG